jgi:probable HAF family extracellular repeat protein
MNRISGLVILAFVAVSAHAQDKYLVTALCQGNAYGINDHGDVVGYRSVDRHGFLYRKTKGITDIVGSTVPEGNVFASAAAIGVNNSDEVVGELFSVSNASGGYLDVFAYRQGKATDITSSFDPIIDSAGGINNQGAIVGAYDAGTHGPTQRAFLYRNGMLLNLGTLAANQWSAATAINNLGQIVGYSGQEAFLYSNGRLQDIGKFTPFSINDHGWVTGLHTHTASSGAQTTHAVLFMGSWLRDLGTLPGTINSAGVSINNSGEIVGTCTGSGSEPAGVFIMVGNQMMDLNKLILSLGWKITDVGGINDAGEIAATGTNNKAQICALLLTPSKGCTIVP